MENKTASVRDRLKIVVADHENRLLKARLRIGKGDDAPLKGLSRLQDTLALYKSILEQIERSAELLAKAA